MPAGDDAVRIGLLGKLPAHGDFVRRGELPSAFCAAWDAWLEAGVAAARAAIGEDRWPAVWDAAPAWRFALPAGACGPEAVAGVLLPSRDTVGRRWPLTLAAVAAESRFAWPAGWFAAVEGVARQALEAGSDADALATAMPIPAAPVQVADPLASFWAALARDAAADRQEAPSPPPAHAREESSPPPAHTQEESAPPSADTREDSPPPSADTREESSPPRADPQEDPSPPAADPAMMATEGETVRPDAGWWTAAFPDGAPGLVWPLAALPGTEEFVLLLEAEP